MNSTLSVIILTANERLHIRRCIEKIKPLAREVFVVDCHSTDGTQAIAQACGARVVEHDWPGNQADQLNWAIDHLPITGDWVLRLDADEYLTDALKTEIETKLDALPAEVAGVTMSFRVVFMGKQLRFGMPRVELLRLWRRGLATCERRKMDEHMVLTAEGRIVRFNGYFVDDNRNDLVWWTQKHLGYARREVEALQQMDSAPPGLSAQAARKRRAKGVYAKLPLFWRSAAYFLFRYVVLLGFLDGRAGFLRAFLQAWWYRTLVDALLYEAALETTQESAAEPEGAQHPLE